MLDKARNSLVYFDEQRRLVSSLAVWLNYKITVCRIRRIQGVKNASLYSYLSTITENGVGEICLVISSG